MCCVVPFAVSKSKSSHEDAGQEQGKFDSGSRRGGDPCSVSHRLRVERAEPFAEGLALGFELDGRRPGHTRARRSAATAWDPSLATSWVPSAATAWGTSASTAWVPSPATAWGELLWRPLGSVSGNRMGRLICYTETRSTR